eukprot:m.344905 g.344905  ORF g.344905 m.344905 type:complete len:452 (+) comp25383_c0_seq1:138-1493(+)
MYFIAIAAFIATTTTSENCSYAKYDGYNIEGSDLLSFLSQNVTACIDACCEDSSCAGYTFTSYQPNETKNCPQGSSCCWLKSSISAKKSIKANCSSGSMSNPPTPVKNATYYIPALEYVSTIALDMTGNLRDPSAVVQDPVTKLYHFWVDYMPGSINPGWNAVLHHYSAPAITGPWTNHGLAINHSTDPNAWDFNGTFSPSVIYSADETPPMWYLFYSASGANHSTVETCAQLVASSSSPDGPWEKLGPVAVPTGLPPSWNQSWNARRLDSGRALIIGGRKGYWTKGVKDQGSATEGVYFAASQNTFSPPYVEYENNPLFPLGPYDNKGYENCEFFMGPPGEKNSTHGLMHIICSWHGGDGLPGYSHGPVPHFVSDLESDKYGLNWTYAGSLSFVTHPVPLEPTPVYENGIPGDGATVNYFIARHTTNNRGSGYLAIGLFKLSWVKPTMSN